MSNNDEARRLDALRRYTILDTGPEETCDGIVRLAARIFGVPTALVSLVAEDRQWGKARHGLELRETPRVVSFCARAMEGDGVLVVPDAAADPAFSDNPLVTGEPRIRFYAGAPLRTRDGNALGTLCLIDHRPRESFGPADRLNLLDLADIVVRVIEQREAPVPLRGQGERDRADLDERLQAIKDSAPLSIITYDREGRVTGWNPAAERIFGWTRQEVLGRPPPHVPGAVRAEFEEAIGRSPGGGGFAGSDDTRRIRRDGAPIDCRVSTVPLKDDGGGLIGFVSFAEDVTERRAMEREGRARSERLRRQSQALEKLAHDANLSDGDLPWFLPRLVEIAALTLKASAAGIWFVDRSKGELRSAALFGRGVEAGAALPIPVAEVRTYLDAVQKERGLASANVWTDPRLAELARSRGRRASPAVALLDSPVRIAQRLEAIVSIEHDEAREWAEDERAFVASLADFVVLVLEARERQTALQRLEIERNRAQTASRAKSRFLSSISHELRTPLNSIIGFSEILHSEMLGPLGNERYREYVADILSGGRNLLEIIDDILTFTRGVVEEAAEDQEGPVAVGDLVEAAITRVALSAAERTVAIRPALPPDLPGLHGLRGSLVRALTGVVANAVKFSPPGSTIEIAACADDSGLSIVVADQGIGMAAQDVPLALEPFEQLDGGLDRGRGGLGLGLSLAKSIVELHDGELVLESTEGAGTTVAILLPASRLSR